MTREAGYPADARVLEWLKADLAENVGVLFKSLFKAGNDATIDALAALIINAYILGRRVGINYQVLDMRIKHQLNTSISDLDEVDHIHGDLAQLQCYIESRGKDQKKR
ncbi:MAG: MazG-like family protein [Syntrophomonadaceae bacterium]